MPSEIILGSLRYRIRPNPNEVVEILDHEGLHDKFYSRLSRSNVLPANSNAPLASWFLARLAYIVRGSLGIKHEIHADGGEIVFNVLVSRVAVDWETEAAQNGQGLLFDTREFSPPPRQDIQLAYLTFYCGGGRIDSFATRFSECNLDEIYDTLIAELLAEPNKLEPYRVTIFDPEWFEDPEMYEPTPDENSKNEYGWDGKELLGVNNIRLKSRRGSN